MLLKHIAEQELINRAIGEAPRVSFFLVCVLQEKNFSSDISFTKVDSVSLVFQQYAAIKQQISHPVAWFCGAQGTDNWNQELWKTKFADNLIIVCTAEVLAQCLMHSFVRMDQINLLIFDEAHHAKKNHPYAKYGLSTCPATWRGVDRTSRILKQFYHPLGLNIERPRIFGMTASPIDANTDVLEAAQ